MTFGNILKNPEKGYIGFVYMIKQKSTSKKYIGMKHFYTKKKVESNWKDYTSSCKTLKELIKITPEDFEYSIVALCKDETSLKYTEAKMILEEGALESDKYFNENVRICLMKKLSKMNSRVKYL